MTTGRGDLTSFNAAGNATFEPNPKYQGPQKAQVRFVKEIAYTTIQGEESDLLNNNLSIGYIDPSVLSSPAPAPGKLGPNWVALAAHYRLVTRLTVELQLRRVQLHLVGPQRRGGRSALRPSSAPVRGRPTQHHRDRRQGLRLDDRQPAPAEYAVDDRETDRQSLSVQLRRRAHPAERARVDPREQRADLHRPRHRHRTVRREHRPGLPAQLQRRVGRPARRTLDSTMSDEITNWQSLGILITHTTDTFNNVMSDCTGAKPFEICAWGYGWSYVPSRLPLRRITVPAGRGLQRRHLRKSPDDGADQELDLRDQSTLSAYANFAAQQLPVLYQPQANSIVEIARDAAKLHRLHPQSVGRLHAGVHALLIRLVTNPRGCAARSRRARERSVNARVDSLGHLCTGPND